MLSFLFSRSFIFCKMYRIHFFACLFLSMYNRCTILYKLGFPGGSVLKNPPAISEDLRDVSSIPWLGRSHEVGNGNPLHYSCLENPMHRGAWWASGHGISKS